MINDSLSQPPRLILKPLPLPDCVGKNGLSKPASAARFLVWMRSSPGPLNSATMPSPLTMLRKNPAAALRKVYCVVPSQATRWPVSTTYRSPACSTFRWSAPKDENNNSPQPWTSSTNRPSPPKNDFAPPHFVSTVKLASPARYELDCT